MNWVALPRPMIGTRYYRDGVEDTEVIDFLLSFYRVAGDVLEYMTHNGVIIKARDFSYIRVPGVEFATERNGYDFVDQ